MLWRKFNGEPLTVSILDAVEMSIETERELGHALKLCIGTDSQVKGRIIEFGTVIVFIREKRGGFLFVSTEQVRTRMGLKERMLNEVSRSIDIAYQLCPLLEKHHVDLEVHADINTNPSFKSNSALSEAMGYIMSMGFVFKAKPEAFASSYCADKFVH